MKKIYERPAAQLIELQPESLLALSTKDEYSSQDQLSNKKEAPKSTIWDTADDEE